MEQWIRSTFSVVSAGWDEPDGTLHDAFQFWSGGYLHSASIPRFVAMCVGVSVPPTAQALKAVVPEASGWHRHFDAWVEQGLIVAE